MTGKPDPGRLVLQVESDDNTARADKPALCGRLRKERRPSRKGPREEMMHRIITIIGLLAIAAVSTAQVEEVWARRYCPDEDFWHNPAGLAVDGQGNVYVTGRSRVESDYQDYATIKYSPGGTELWVRRYNPSSQRNAMPYVIGLDAAGNVYVTGEVWDDSDFVLEYATIKYAPDGTQLWVARWWGYDQGGGRKSGARPYAMAVDGAGNVHVTGVAGFGDWHQRYGTVKYGPDGRQLWANVFGEQTFNRPQATDIALDAAGNVFVTGWGYEQEYGITTVKYNSAGALQWSVRFDHGSQVVGAVPRIATDRDDNAYVTTHTPGDDGKERYTTVKYSPTGTQLWLRYWQDPEENICVPYAIAVDPSGSAYVFGKAHIGGGSRYATVKYGPDGTELWAVIEEIPTGSWLAVCITLDHEGSVYVTGQGTSEGGVGFTTIKYAPNGDKLWAAHSHQASSSGTPPAGLAVDQAGHVYVTGSWHRTGRHDYMTIKYRQGSGIAESGTPVAPPQAGIGPSPLTGGFATLRYNLPQAGPVRVRVFDVTGRSVFSTRSPGHLATGSVPLDLRALNAGVYLVKLEADGFTTTQKLIIQR